MKIVHTGDWHIGKLVHGVHMTEDQRYILGKFKEFLREEKPDVLIIAGDIYDRSIPPVEAVELLDEFLSDVLIELDIKIFAIAGNHDSPDRIAFGNKILEKRGLHIVGEVKGEIKPVRLQDEYGYVNIYLLPYMEPAIIRKIFSDEEIKTHDDAYKKVLDGIKAQMDESERNILVTHAFLGGVDIQESESEKRLSIGGSDLVSVEYFKDFDYTALGHIHKPQRVKYDHIRYAGSLLKYSFSEHNQKKGITLLEMKEKGNLEIDNIHLPVEKDMRQIKGELDELLAAARESQKNNEDYIMAILTDQGEIIDAIGKLRGVYPNILRIERAQFERKIENERTAAGEDFIKKNPCELFSEFYENIVGDDLDEGKTSLIQSVVEELNLEGRELK